MKFSVNRIEFAAAAAAVSRAVSSRTTLAILENICLHAQGDYVELKATDLDTYITARVNAEVQHQGGTALNARSLLDYLSRVDAEQLLFTEDNGKCVLQAGRGKVTLLASRADDYPQLPDHTWAAPVVLPQADVKTMLGRVAFCTSKEESRSLLQGVHVAISAEYITMTATDTHRMSRVCYKLPTPSPGLAEAVIPAKPLVELERLIQRGEGDLQIEVDGKMARFTTPQCSLITRVIDGVFPNCDKIIPKTWERTVKFNVGDLAQAVNRVEVVAKTCSHKVIFGFKESTIEVKAESSEAGVVSDQVRGDLTGEPLAMGFNGRYWQDALSHIPEAKSDQEVTLYLNGALNPVLLKSNDGRWTHVLMPMQA